MEFVAAALVTVTLGGSGGIGDTEASRYTFSLHDISRRIYLLSKSFFFSRESTNFQFIVHHMDMLLICMK